MPLRLTEEEYNRLFRKPPSGEGGGSRKRDGGRANKFNAQKVELDGILFDSQHEADRYTELDLMLRAGEISDLRRQVKYVLVPAKREPDTIGPRGGVKKGKIIEREMYL